MEIILHPSLPGSLGCFCLVSLLECQSPRHALLCNKTGKRPRLIQPGSASPQRNDGLGVQLSASLGHPGRRRVVLGQTFDTLQHVIIKKSHIVLSKFTILCWVEFIAILGRMWSANCRLDTPWKRAEAPS